MAKECIYILINGKELRCFGGNASDVRYEAKKYKNLTKEEFLYLHPKWKEEIKRNGYHLKVAGERNIYWEYVSSGCDLAGCIYCEDGVCTYDTAPVKSFIAKACERNDLL